MYETSRNSSLYKFCLIIYYLFIFYFNACSLSYKILSPNINSAKNNFFCNRTILHVIV